MRRALALVGVLPLLAVPPVAADEPGSGFVSLSASAVGSGQSFRFTASNQVPAEVWIPYAAADLKLGAGTATSSVAWPGEVGSTIGTAAIILGAPPQAEMLNDPFVARARTGSGARDVHNASLPGSTMDAHASPGDLHAETSTSLVESVASVAGSTTATARLRLTGPSTATAEATSSVRDVTVAGVVHVASVVSRATGTTDGLHADASGGTVVTGLTVAGQAVTLDDTGLHVAGTALPADQVRDAVESALAQAQVTLALGQPTRQVRGGQVEYATGSLLVVTPLGVLSLGGAQLRLAAGLDDPVPPVPPTGGAPAPGVAAPGGPSTGPALAGTGDQVTPVTPGGPLPRLVRSVAQALRPLGLTTGYGWAWVPAGVLLALLSGAVLRRLPAAVLPAPPSPCPTEDQP
jgi:hypothetical protein